MKLILGMLLGAILFALPARADTIYDINATATITGNDACGGPCVETLTFSFMLEQVDPFNTTVLPGGTFTSSGPIPYGSGPMPGESPEADAFGDLRFFYSPPGGFGTDELDLAIGCVSTPFPCTPSLLGGATLYSCGDMTCVSDFCFGDCSNLAPNYEGGVASGPIVGTITVVNPPSATPEPGEAGLLMLGVGLLGLAYRSGMRPGQFNIEGPEFRPLDGVLLAFLETVEDELHTRRDS